MIADDRDAEGALLVVQAMRQWTMVAIAVFRWADIRERLGVFGRNDGQSQNAAEAGQAVSRASW
jgi:hypothetical protein